MISPETKVRNINLPSRAYGALREANIETVEDLTKALEDGRLFHVRNIGVKTIARIIKAIEYPEKKVWKLFYIRVNNFVEINNVRYMDCSLVPKAYGKEINFIARSRNYNGFVIFTSEKNVVFPVSKIAITLSLHKAAEAYMRNKKPNSEIEVKF